MESKVLLVLALVASALVAVESAATCEERKQIVNLNNELRGLLARGELKGQPKAGNMEMMLWDDALANSAQNWADKSTGDHSVNGTMDRWHPKWKYDIIENIDIADVFEKKVNLNYSIHNWYSEHTKFTYSTEPEPAVYKVAGHYLAMIGAYTNYIGCGYAFKNTEFPEKWKALVVCHYGPIPISDVGGPYDVGTGCAKLCCDKKDCPNDVKKYGENCV